MAAAGIPLIFRILPFPSLMRAFPPGTMPPMYRLALILFIFFYSASPFAQEARIEVNAGGELRVQGNVLIQGGGNVRIQNGANVIVIENGVQINNGPFLMEKAAPAASQNLEPIAPFPPFEMTPPEERTRQTRDALARIAEGNFRERGAAREALAAMAFPDSELLSQQAKAADPEVSETAKERLRHLKAWGPATYVPWLQSLCEAPDPHQWELLNTLAEFSEALRAGYDWQKAWQACLPTDNTEWLRTRGIQDVVPRIRRLSLEALIRAQDPSLADLLPTLMQDPEVSVSALAAGALVSRGDRTGLPVLFTVLESHQEHSVAEAARWLKQATGMPHPFDPYADAPSRQAAARAWRTEWENQASATLLPLNLFDSGGMLFDGSGLGGWWYTSSSNLPLNKVWTIDDGVLSGNGTDQGALLHKLDTSDFCLSLEWRLKGMGGDSGVFFGVEDAEKAHQMKFVEVQLYDGHAGDIWLRGDRLYKQGLKEQAQGMFAATQRPPEKPPGQWNHLEVRIEKGSLRCSINGALCNEISGFDAVPRPLGLQMEGHAVDFRNIRLDPLD